MQRKTVSFPVLPLVMAALLLAGCGGSKPSGGTSGDSLSQKVYIYQNSGAGTGTGSEAGSNPEVAQKVKELIMEQTGIEPVLIMPPKGTVTEKLNLLLSSNESLDLFWGDWPEYQNRNALLPINDLLQQHGPNVLAQITDVQWKALTDSSGKIWGVPRNSPMAVYPAYVREDWLEKVGLSQPKTVEDLEGILAAFAQRNLSGGNNVIPMITTLRGIRNGLSAAFTGVGYNKWYDEANKTVKPVELHPGYKAFLETLNRWYTRGYIYKESFTIQRQQLRDLITQNRVGVVLDWYSNVTFTEYTLNQNVPEALYGIADIKGSKGMAQTVQPAPAKGALIPKRSENAENAVKLLDWQMEDVNHYLTTFLGIEGEDFTYEMRDGIAAYSQPSETVRYFGEYCIAQGSLLELSIASDSPSQKKHSDYLTQRLNQIEHLSIPLDIDFQFDITQINQSVPTLGDLERMIDEETIKFIVGVRPISDYDNFISELQRAGLQSWIDAYTAQYNNR